MSLVFVHGTGVRIEGYRSSFETAKSAAAEAGINDEFIECVWGDPLGIEFYGKSLPDPPTGEVLQREEQDFEEWSWRLHDPLFELQMLAIPDSEAIDAPPHSMPAWKKLWGRIENYQPSEDLKLLLRRVGLDGNAWQKAWGRTMASPVPMSAFEASSGELAEASNALARALVAQLSIVAELEMLPIPNATSRKKMVQRLLTDWGQNVYGLGAWFGDLVSRGATWLLRKNRSRYCHLVSLQVGDILLYQARGEEIRDFIRKRVSEAKPPVTLYAHSLGGIACVDLLAMPNPPEVAKLVTVGSQSPLLAEIGALTSLRPNRPLPIGFPSWLNIYDRNDFLSFCTREIWPNSQAQDWQHVSGLPFPDSHGAYVSSEECWKKVKEFIGQ